MLFNKICVNLLHIIINVTFGCLFICCSPDNLSHEILKTLPISQLNVLQNMLNELKPKFVLLTYLIDPFIDTTCYIFIENIFSKEIKHYTILFNNSESIESVKHKILHSDIINKDILSICLHNTTYLNNEINDLKNSFTCYPVMKYNNIIKRIVSKFSMLIYKIDKFFLSKLDFNDTFFENQNTFKNYICICLESFLSLSKDIKNTQLLHYKSICDISQIDYLKTFIRKKINNFDKEKFSFAHMDLNEIYIFAKCIYAFCTRSAISSDQVMKYVLELIFTVKNKINKFTFFLCFLKIYSEEVNLRSKPRLLKLTTFIWIYFENPQIDLNNKKYLVFLYKLCKNCKFENISYNGYIEICFIENTSEDEMKKIIIKRYAYFIMLHTSVFLHVLTELLSSEQYFNIIWLTVKTCIVSVYNIFNMDL